MMLKKDVCNHRRISEDELYAALGQADGIDSLCERLHVELCDKCKARLEKRWLRLLNSSNELYAYLGRAA